LQNSRGLFDSVYPLYLPMKYLVIILRHPVHTHTHTRARARARARAYIHIHTHIQIQGYAHQMDEFKRPLRSSLSTRHIRAISIMFGAL